MKQNTQALQRNFLITHTFYSCKAQQRCRPMENQQTSECKPLPSMSSPLLRAFGFWSVTFGGQVPLAPTSPAQSSAWQWKGPLTQRASLFLKAPCQVGSQRKNTALPAMCLGQGEGIQASSHPYSFSLNKFLWKDIPQSKAETPLFKQVRVIHC